MSPAKGTMARDMLVLQIALRRAARAFWQALGIVRRGLVAGDASHSMGRLCVVRDPCNRPCHQDRVAVILALILVVSFAALLSGRLEP